MKKLLIISSLILLATACKKEPDSPPENLLIEANAVTIDSLRAWQQNVSPDGLSITQPYHVYGIITMDESDGNLYKNLYMQDHTAGIQIRMLSTSDFAVGDSVRVNLKGAYLSEYAGVIQLDSIDPETMIVRRSSGNEFLPENKNLLDITFDDEGKLIIIDSVQFQAAELSNTYADHINQSSQNRMLEDCNGNTIIVRTSGFANYAGQTVKQGNGTMVAVVSRFDQDLQLYIRSLDELLLDGPRCAGQFLVKDFEDQDINSGGWTTFVVTGPATVDWSTNDMGWSSFYAQITNWNGSSNDAAETWLISPALNLSGSSAASVEFMNACNYNGPNLQLMVSTDYSGSGDPTLATWTDLSSSATWSTGSWNWVNSGVVDLSAYLTSATYIGFRYTGGASDGKTWELDDIIING